MKQEIKDRIEKIKRGKVPDGFKKTKVGIVPKDWDIINAKDAFDLIGGNAFKSSDSKEKGIRWLKIANVDTGNIKWETVDYLPSEFEYEYPDYLLHENDIVMALTRPILNGKLKIAYIKKDDAPSLLNQRVGKIKLRKNVNGRYIYHYLSKSSTVNSLETVIAGTDPPNLGKGDLDKLDVVCPNHAEQQKIASILSTWDRAIELKEKLIEEKKKQKKGLLQKLLTGDIRLPGFYGDWKEVKLVEVCSINKGSQLNKANMIENGKYPALNGGISPSGYTNNWNSEKDTITVSEGGNSCGFVNYINERFWCGGHCYAVIPDLKVINNLFMYQILKYNETLIMGLRVGSGLPNIQKKSLEEFCIRIPILSEQEAIAHILTTADKEITLLEQELEALKLQKKGLMQLLLTGIVRVNTEN